MCRGRGPSILKESGKFVVWGSMSTEEEKNKCTSLHAPFAVNGRNKVNMRGREERVTKKTTTVRIPHRLYTCATPRPYQEGTCSLLTEIDSKSFFIDR